MAAAKPASRRDALYRFILAAGTGIFEFLECRPMMLAARQWQLSVLRNGPGDGQ
jgi:hypothetical protein